MALTVLKRTPIHCVVKISAASTETIDLDSSTLLIAPYEVAQTPKVHIMGLHYSLSGATPTTIVRNSVTIYSILGNWSSTYNGFVDSQQEASDIVVTIPAGGGHVILELLKVSGYGDTQHRNQTQG